MCDGSFSRERTQREAGGLDAEERGFLDTLRALSLAGIAHVGDGNDLADARKLVIVSCGQASSAIVS
jgi:hypothetical protein